MRDFRRPFYFAAFFCLTALKLLSPEPVDSLRAALGTLLEGGCDYYAMTETLGRGITEAAAREQLVAALGLGSPAPESELIGALSREEGDDAQMHIRPGAGPDTEGGAASLPGDRERGPECRSADESVRGFLREQSGYAGCVIPANVRIDMPELELEYASPVRGQDSSGFGFRLHPLKNEIRFHYGTDYAAERGAAVLAFADGYVYAAGTGESYGNYYILTHKGGVSTLYAHLSEFVALEGEMVKKGQLIGRVGDTGDATGPHLHFELLLNDVYINPEYYL